MLHATLSWPRVLGLGQLGLLALLTTVMSPTASLADVRLPHVFSDHMVLQRGVRVPVFGFADPGESITVRFGEHEVTTEAKESGEWRVDLPSLEANAEPQTLTVAGENTVEFSDVLVGDVWICSGQSNMEWTVKISANPDEEIAAADYPLIRLFDVPQHLTGVVPREECPGEWKVCGPETVASFSAVGYYFGRELHRETGVPIGMLGSNWGGTRIEPWTPPIGFRRVPELSELSEQVDQFALDTESGRKTWRNYLEAVEAYAEEARAAWERGRALPDPVPAPGFSTRTQPTTIYNAMIHPLVPYAIRGVIWYQGESNGSEGIEYFHKMRALIEGWRAIWGQREFPIYFYYVQLANFQKPNENAAGGDGWAKLREAQTQALEIPHTGMAVTIDIGQADDIHPKNKQDVGKRLARWALRDVYGKALVVSGPVYREMEVKGNEAHIRFDHAGSGLMIGKKSGLEPTQPAPDESIRQLAIADQDGNWHWAEGRIEGDTLIVSSDQVERPAAVRYGFSMNPQGANLYNREGLPASPFRTDRW